MSINTNPAWWAWKACKETVNFLCGSQPSKVKVSTVVDTRTGARVDLTTSGKFGLECGYEIYSGSVTASTEYTAKVVLPSRNPGAYNYFNLNPDSQLVVGTITSQSPTIGAYMNAVAQFSGTASARACLILAGCTPTGTINLPSVNTTLPILSADPNNLNVLPICCHPTTRAKIAGRWPRPIS